MQIHFFIDDMDERPEAYVHYHHGRRRLVRYHSDHRPHRTEIMYIRSPISEMRGDGMFHKYRRSASQADFVDEEFDDRHAPQKLSSVSRNPPDNPPRQVNFSDTTANNVTYNENEFTKPHDMSKKKYKRSATEVTLTSEAEAVIPPVEKIDPSNVPFTVSNGGPSQQPSLPGSVGHEADEHEEELTKVKMEEVITRDLEPDLIVSHTEEVSLPSQKEVTIDMPSSTTINYSETDKSVEHQLAIIERNETFDRSEDSDSGIHQPGGIINGNLRLKNRGMMEKKSIFTIAYDGVKTKRLKSADSESYDLSKEVK